MPRRNADSADIHIGQRIRLARQMVRMSQKALATRLEVSFQQLQKYEKGVNRTTVVQLWKIADILGQEIAWFADGLVSPPGGPAKMRITDDAISLASHLDRLTGDRRTLAFKIVSACLDAFQAAEESQ